MKTTDQESPLGLLKTALPLILTWLSSTLMLFADRFLLAKYSLTALGAAVNAGTIAWGFGMSFQIFTEMAQVLVSQFKGAKQLKKLSTPTWQMIWLSLLSFIWFLPLSLFGVHLFFDPRSLQGQYFSIITLFGPMFALIGATSSYFIGTAQSKIVTYAALLGNVINIVLDIVLIFGIPGKLPPMGIKGAAIATGIGLSVQALTLFIIFLKKTNFEYKLFNRETIKSCFKTGFAPALNMGVELVGWGLFFSMMGKTSELHLIITSLCQTFMPLFAAVSLGLQRTIASECAQHIGAKSLFRIKKIVFSALIVIVVYHILLFSLASQLPYSFLSFLASSKMSSLTGSYQKEIIISLLKPGLLLMIGYLFFWGLRSVFSGVLSAAGDSKFMSYFGAFSIWILLLLPIHFFIVTKKGGVSFAQSLLLIYGLLCASIYFIRYLSGKWRAKSLLIKDQVEI